MRLISEPSEGVTATIAFQYNSTSNYIAETGDVLGTGSNQVITGTSSIIMLDKVAYGRYLISAANTISFGGRWKSRNVSKVWASSGTTGNHRIYEWQDSLTATIGYLRVNPTTHVLELWGASLLASSLATVSNLTNYHIELTLFINATNGTAQVKLDGATVINFSGNTGSSPIVYVLQRGPGIAIGDVDATLGHWHDDFYINNTSNVDGKNDTGLAGQIKMIVRLPTANGTYTTFTPSPGSNANYQNVNSLSNTVNNNFSSNPGLLDSFPVAASGLGTVTITACTTRALAQSTISPQLISLGVRQNSVDYISASQSVPIAPQLLYDSRQVLNPNTGLPWTVPLADANQIIYEHAPI